MKNASLAGICLALIAPCGAQEPAAQAAIKQAPVKQQGAEQVSAGRKAYETMSERFDAAVERYQKAYATLRATPKYKAVMAKARETRDYSALRELTSKIERVDYNAWARRFVDAAKEHRGDAAEIDFLLWSLRSNDKAIVGPAVQRMLDKYIRSSKLSALAKGYYGLSRTLGEVEAQRVLAHLIGESPDKSVQAAALYTRAYPIVAGRRRGSAPTEQQLAQAKKDMARVLEIAPGSNWALKLQGPQFEREKLQIGMVAPDIVGDDLDGVSFKLSDYRGKVVVLDFWGDW